MLDKNFKRKLQSIGPLRPEAWDAIVNMAQKVQIKPRQNFIREVGSIAYVQRGLLKEYDSHNRKRPAIINFISEQQCFYTRLHDQQHYMRANLPSTIFYWDEPAIERLYSEFPELLTIYENLCTDYYQQLMSRMVFLEMGIMERLAHFRSKYRSILPYLKRKDIANYLNISYGYFLSIS